MVLPTGRFLAESKYKMSKEEERPSLAWSLSALMSVSTYQEGEVSTGTFPPGFGLLLPNCACNAQARGAREQRIPTCASRAGTEKPPIRASRVEIGKILYKSKEGQ